MMPLFVAGFLGAIALSSTGLIPTGVLDGARTLQQILLAAALSASAPASICRPCAAREAER